MSYALGVDFAEAETKVTAVWYDEATSFPEWALRMLPPGYPSGLPPILVREPVVIMPSATYYAPTDQKTHRR